MLNGIRCLFYSIYKIAKYNYGEEGGANASFIILSFLFSINLISILGLFLKLFFDIYTISLISWMFIWIIALIINYIIFIYKMRYKEVVLYFEERKKKSLIRGVSTLLYICGTFGLFIFAAFI
jgi:hypothetical protein